MKEFKLNAVSPVGRLPEPDAELTTRINNLPKGAKIKDFIKAVDEWENIAMVKFKEIEQKARSHELGP